MRISHDSRISSRRPVAVWRPSSGLQRGRPPLVAACVCTHTAVRRHLHNKVVYQAASPWMPSPSCAAIQFSRRRLSAGSHDSGRASRRRQAAINFLPRNFRTSPVSPFQLRKLGWPSRRLCRSSCHRSDCPRPSVNNTDFTISGAATTSSLSMGQRCACARTKLPNSSPRCRENHLSIVDRADHFFSGHLHQLDQAITTWLVRRHPELARS